MIDINSHGLTPGELLHRRMTRSSAGPPLQPDDLGAFGAPDRVSPGEEILPSGREGRPLLLVGGSAGEIRALDARRRQILRLRLPGDVLFGCDRESVVALGRAQVVDARPFFDRLEAPEAPVALRRAWLEMGRADQNLARDHLVRLGRMTSLERVAHLLVETHARLDDVGLVDGDTFQLPMTQEAMSDLLGVSGVHLSRTLQTLRRDSMINLKSGRVTFLDRRRVADLCRWSASTDLDAEAGRPTTRRPLVSEALVA